MTTNTCTIYDNHSALTDTVWAYQNTIACDAASASISSNCSALEQKKKEETKPMFNFNEMFKPVEKGLCKFSIDGNIAVKTSAGYRTFDIKTQKLINCSNFAFDADNLFWVIPTTKVSAGDIIMFNNAPHMVLEVLEKTIKVFNYSNSTVVEIIPESFIFMGKTCFYKKISSPFAAAMKSNAGMSSMMKMIMMSQMFGGKDFNPMMLMLLNKEDIFNDDIFGMGEEDGNN